MRPVTIVAAPNYVYDADAALDNNVPQFAGGSSVANAYDPAGAAITRSVRWCQNRLLDIVNGVAVPYPNLNPANQRRLVKQALRGRLYDEYTQARNDLTDMIGSYCSFCELPLPAHLMPIEHVCAKAKYPTFTVWWWNFLLACRDCNSIKASRPPRATATGWAGVVGPTENQLRAAILNHYYWADNDQDTYRVIDRSYWYDVNLPAPTQLLIGEFSSKYNRLVSMAGTRVTANVKLAGGMHNNTRVKVRIFNNNGGAKGNETLTLTGIGLHVTARAALRTRQWLFACQQLRGLFDTINALPPINKQPTFRNMFRFIERMAVQSGFYSTWVEILTHRNFPAGVPNGGHANLGAFFIFDTQTANTADPTRVFPGTDATQVP